MIFSKYNFILFITSLIYINQVYAQTKNKIDNVTTIKSVSDIEEVEPNTVKPDYNKTIRIKLLLNDNDSSNYHFDSLWVFIPPSNIFAISKKSTLIYKYKIHSFFFKSNICELISFALHDNSGKNTSGTIAQDEYSMFTKPKYPCKLGVYPGTITDKARLYYTYKGKWQVARFRGKIIYTPIEEYRYKRKHANDNDPVTE